MVNKSIKKIFRNSKQTVNLCKQLYMAFTSGNFIYAPTKKSVTKPNAPARKSVAKPPTPPIKSKNSKLPPPPPPPPLKSKNSKLPPPPPPAPVVNKKAALISALKQNKKFLAAKKKLNGNTNKKN